MQTPFGMGASCTDRCTPLSFFCRCFITAYKIVFISAYYFCCYTHALSIILTRLSCVWSMSVTDTRSGSTYGVSLKTQLYFWVFILWVIV